MPWLKYSEGNANILFRNSEEYSGKLLRVRKRKKSDMSTIDIYNFWLKRIEPRLKEYSVDMKIMTLNPTLKQELTDLTNEIDLNEQYALFIESMGLTGQPRRVDLKYNHGIIWESTNNLMLEFKPKWLVKSPNFSENSMICRNCALRYHRDGQIPGFCPSTLSPGTRSETVRQGFECLLEWYEPRQGCISKDALLDIIANFWTWSDVRDRLADMQKLDRYGILRYAEDSPLEDDFLVAMSARDCTVFIEISTERPGKPAMAIKVSNKIYYVVCKLADLDKKSGVEKRNYWRSLESSLFDIMSSNLRCLSADLLAS